MPLRVCVGDDNDALKALRVSELQTKGGRKVSVEFVSNLFDCEGTAVIQCNIRDITARRQAEERITELDHFKTLNDTLGQNLCLSVIAEGVEIEAQRDSHYLSGFCVFRRTEGRRTHP